MKNKFSVVLSGETLNVYFNGRSCSFIKGTPEFAQALKCVKEEDYKSYENLFIVNPAKHLKSLSDGKLDWRDGEVWIGTSNGDKKLPNDLYKSILEFKDLGLSYDRLVKFAHKLLEHPEPESVDQFYAFVRKHKLTICEDGDFIAYKGVRSDYKDMHSGTVDWSPGKKVSMPRNEVDHARDSLCSRGLHVCAWEYLSYFGGDKKIAVKVDPRNVVSVPKDHNDAKIRLCEALVLQDIDRPIDHVVSDLDKQVNTQTMSSDENTVIWLLDRADCMAENVFFFKEEDKFVVFHVANDVSDDVSYKFEGKNTMVWLSPETFKNGVKLLKNKKSGYYEPMLLLKQAYRKGLVKMLNVSEEYSDFLLQLA